MAAGCHKWADSKICLCMADKKPAGAGLFKIAGSHCSEVVICEGFYIHYLILQVRESLFLGSIESSFLLSK